MEKKIIIQEIKGKGSLTHSGFSEMEVIGILTFYRDAIIISQLENTKLTKEDES